MTVVGEDVYGLDDDGDGIGCDAGTGGPPAGDTDDNEAPAAEPVEEEPDLTG